MCTQNTLTQVYYRSEYVNIGLEQCITNNLGRGSNKKSLMINGLCMKLNHSKL